MLGEFVPILFLVELVLGWLPSVLIRSKMALSRQTSHILTLLVATILPPCIRGAEPLKPSCPEDARTCEFFLEATPQFTMTLVDESSGSVVWSPVRAQPWGLEAGVDDGEGRCHQANKNLTAEGQSWASYQIYKIAGCACAGNVGNISPPSRVSDPDMHHDTCVMHVQWCYRGR